MYKVKSFQFSSLENTVTNVTTVILSSTRGERQGKWKERMGGKSGMSVGVGKENYFLYRAYLQPAQNKVEPVREPDYSDY